MQVDPGSSASRRKKTVKNAGLRAGVSFLRFSLITAAAHAICAMQ
jgi:hypothetical protein